LQSPSADFKVKKLPDLKFRNAKPKDRPYRVADRDALFLLVKPNESKLWQYRYRLAGKENIFSIGAYPDVSLEAARKALQNARALVRDGIHPAEARRIERKQKEEARRADAARRADTLETLVTDWLKHVRRAGTPKGRGPWSQARADF